MCRLAQRAPVLVVILLAGGCFLSPQPEPPDLTDQDNDARGSGGGSAWEDPGASDGDGLADAGADGGIGGCDAAGVPSGFCGSDDEGDGSAEPPCPCDDYNDPDCDHGGAVTTEPPDYDRFRLPPRSLPEAGAGDAGPDGGGDADPEHEGDAGAGAGDSQAVDY